MVKSVVDSLLTSLSPRLRVHQLWMCWVLVVLHLLCDALVALILALQKCLLVREELCLGAALLSLPLVGGGLEAALVDILRVLHLLNALLLKLELAILLPIVEASHVLQSDIFALQLFLFRKQRWMD